MGWLEHILGLDNASGVAYLAWSGIVGDLGYLAVIGGMIAVVRRHQCEVHRCWRMGKHTTAAAHHVCHKHDPDQTQSRLSAWHVLARHIDAGGKVGDDV